MKSANILSMQQAIISYIHKQIPKDDNKAKSGRISGNRVIVGSKSYPFTSTIDKSLHDGDGVFCIFPDSKNTAVVVGVA